MADEKVLVFNPEYCTGCMRCMTTCSTYNNGATSLTKSRIHVIRHEGHAITRIDEEDDLVFDIITCQQCDEPRCMYFCPTMAIERDGTTRAMKIDHDKCMVCRMCVVSCPFGAIFYDADAKQVIKCEFCGGDPQCVKFCPTGALQFMPKKLTHLPRRDRLARTMIQLRIKGVEPIPTNEE